MASSSSSSLWIYDVFLSFRGEETRKGFVSHLYAELQRKGIYTFKDDKKMDKGSSISPSLFKAIEDSKFAIVVISANYASSGWCMDELVKIVECAEQGSLTVVPIFYEVDPSDVRNQLGSFAEALEDHEENFRCDPERVQKWRKALTFVANIAGEDSRNWENEAEGVQRIAHTISTRLFSISAGEIDEVVGLEARLKKMAHLLCFESTNECRIIGIWGMGGVGKTNIATCVYNRHLHEFQAHCFFEIAGQHNVRYLQERLLSEIFGERDVKLPIGSNALKARLRHLKVLIVLDNVDKLVQLEALAGSVDWFGLGSRIFITTRDKHLLVANGVEHIYEVKCLIHDEALQLFSQYAFGQKHVKDGFENLSLQVVHYAAGLPLALKVLGSFLRGRSIGEWESTLCKLRKTPNKDVMEVLKVSYDGLDEETKSTFLHAACLFDQYDDRGIHDFRNIMDACGYNTEIEIHNLYDKSLLETSTDIKMHDLLRQMGRVLVRQQCIDEPEKRQFLMDVSNAFDVLKNNTGVNDKAFEKMPNLQFLKFTENSGDRTLMQFPRGLSYLPRKLRLLSWSNCSLLALSFGFCPEFLVILDMPRSNLKKLWEGTQPLENLKWVNLRDSHNLTELPDLSRAVNLEVLDLYYCKSLVQLPSSIQSLYKLYFLCLTGCKRLEHIPNINSRCVSWVGLGGCSRLRRLPKICT